MPFPRIAKFGLMAAAVFVVSYVASSGISRFWPGTALEVAAPIASGTMPLSFLAVTAPQLSASIILNGNSWNDPAPLALPSGSRFEIGLRSNQSGTAEVWAINPQGKTSRISVTRLQANQNQRTHSLRLEGTPGQETLRIIFKGDATGATLVKDLNILHV